MLSAVCFSASKDCPFISFADFSLGLVILAFIFQNFID